MFIVFHVSIWGAWRFVWGAKPTKAPPWRRDWCYSIIKVNILLCGTVDAESRVPLKVSSHKTNEYNQLHSYLDIFER